ncbi:MULTISPECIES: Gfo/Idh/MocA family oxidoreductase [Amycolatopsis]|uniref:Oxidoreductase n=1 Tax=Amycolatopsis dongchuanensis TaxID=1070866 RepID=A0ABP9PUE3_9PSEU
MTALRIGLVDLDTSHPECFLPFVRAHGHEVVAVYDGGTVWDPGYAERFAAQHGIATVCRSLDEMAARVDVAFLHGCDWDLRIERARPFAEAGVGLLVDKPFGGTGSAIHSLVSYAETGLRITGGSALRWCTEVRRWRAEHAGDPAEFALVGCSGEEFDYGIHAYSMLHGLFGPGVVEARHLGGHGQQRVELRWEDGRTAMVSVGPTQERHPFHATVLSGRSVRHLIADPDGLYEEFLNATLPYLAGEAPAPLPLRQLVEPELAALAGLVSRRDGGRWVELRDPALDAVSFDGAAFGARYRAAKRGG